MVQFTCGHGFQRLRPSWAPPPYDHAPRMAPRNCWLSLTSEQPWEIDHGKLNENGFEWLRLRLLLTPPLLRPRPWECGLEVRTQRKRFPYIDYPYSIQFYVYIKKFQITPLSWVCPQKERIRKGPRSKLRGSFVMNIWSSWAPFCQDRTSWPRSCTLTPILLKIVYMGSTLEPTGAILAKGVH